MKQFRFSWAALSLLAPILILITMCLGPAAIAKNVSGTPNSTAANLQVVFISSVSGLPGPVANFFLNVTGVRINPFPNASHKATPKETAGNWSLIPVPTPTTPAENPGALPIDMVAGQTGVQVFNTIGIKAKKFNTVEVALDTTNPGFIVPLCNGSGPERPEGCIKYPIQVTGGSLTSQNLVQTILHENTLLPIQLTADVQVVPSAVGDPYQITLNATVLPTPIAFAGTLDGEVKGSKGNTIGKKSHLRVYAELTGTNTIVSSSEVLDGKYTLFLPAAAGVGTSYDLYVFGGSTTIQSEQAVQVLPGGTPSVGFTVKGSQKLGSFAGTITDACTQNGGNAGNPIEGATVQILVPPAGASPVPDCVASPALCVSVASGMTGATGSYPLPGTVNGLTPLTVIPIGSPTATYVIEVSAPGYDTLFMEGTASGVSQKANAVNAGKCFTPNATASPTPSIGSCNFSLNTSYLQGNVSLTASEPSGKKTFINVLAENHGSNTLVGSLPNPVTISSPGNSAPFTLNVPSQAANGTYDLFAVAEDSFQGGPDPYPGHNVLVQSGVTPAAACATAAASFVSSMDCTGHGSIAGSVSNPDGGTSVQLQKGGVAITETLVVLAAPSTTATPGYSFCIPPEDASYSVQRFENASGSPTATGSPALVGLMNTPSVASTPCPSTCSNTNSSCPGNCNPSAGPNL